MGKAERRRRKKTCVDTDVCNKALSGKNLHNGLLTDMFKTCKLTISSLRAELLLQCKKCKFDNFKNIAYKPL